MQKLRPQCCILRTPIFVIPSHEKNVMWIKKKTYNLEIVLNRENHEVLLQKQFMQLIQENPKIETPMLFFIDPRYLPFLIIKKTLSGSKIKYIQVGNGFQT